MKLKITKISQLEQYRGRRVDWFSNEGKTKAYDRLVGLKLNQFVIDYRTIHWFNINDGGSSLFVEDLSYHEYIALEANNEL